MKKIIDGKNNTSKWKMNATCSGKGWEQGGKTPCQSIFELNADDIIKRNYTDMAQDTETYYGFICPDCGCFTELTTSKIPREVRRFAKSYEVVKTTDEYKCVSTLKPSKVNMFDTFTNNVIECNLIENLELITAILRLDSENKVAKDNKEDLIDAMRYIHKHIRKDDSNANE